MRPVVAFRITPPHAAIGGNGLMLGQSSLLNLFPTPALYPLRGQYGLCLATIFAVGALKTSPAVLTLQLLPAASLRPCL